VTRRWQGIKATRWLALGGSTADGGVLGRHGRRARRPSRSRDPARPPAGSSSATDGDRPLDVRCPVRGTLLTYSQSDNPSNPHYADQKKTRLFSQKRRVPDRFCTASVLRDTKRTMVLERAL
jgi:hypothetical protein